MTSHHAVVPASLHARGWGWRHAGRLAWAVERLDLSVEPGERVLLLGASGSGKSTLLQAMAGVLGDDEGESVGELHLDRADPRASRGRAGLVLQDPDSQVMLERVGDDVAFGCENLGVPREEIWRRVSASLEAVGLAVPLDRSTSTLSGGQKQRLALAGVLAMRPGLLLLDEPTANLDPEGVRQVRDAVARVLDATGSTLVVVEHRVEVWQGLVDRVVVLDPRGGLLADGPIADVLGRHGAALADAGIWVPGHPPRVGLRSARPAGRAMTVRDVSIARTRGTLVQEHIDLEIDSGRMLAITGPNGVGKSTLGLTLGGLLPPAAGAVDASPIAEGLDPHPHRWRSRDLLPRIATVFQDPDHQFVAATVREELLVGPRALRLDGTRQQRIVDDLASRLRLDALLRANPFTLSGGEKRRLSVATALATAPRCLVLDEPTFGQDARTWAELVGLLGSLADDGAAIVVITHDLELAAHADREYRMTAS